MVWDGLNTWELARDERQGSMGSIDPMNTRPVESFFGVDFRPTYINGACFVNARDLHRHLESSRKFTDWFKHHIKALDLIDGLDYSEYFVTQVGENSKGRPSRDFLVTLQAGLRICMNINTETGKKYQRILANMLDSVVSNETGRRAIAEHRIIELENKLKRIDS
jgi:phage anti-repressor protein